MEEEKEGPLKEISSGVKKREIDLNALFPEKGYDLNRLFPDDETKRFLYELKRNKKEIERLIKSLDLEED